MITPEELEDRIRRRTSAFLEAREAGALFTMDELVTVIWPEINEASARDASDKVLGELDSIGLGARTDHVVPSGYNDRERLTETLTRAVLQFAQHHQWLDIAVERNEDLEQLEAMRRMGLIWSWSDGENVSEYDDYSDPLGEGYEPKVCTFQMTSANVFALVTLLEQHPDWGREFRKLLREVMTEEQAGH